MEYVALLELLSLKKITQDDISKYTASKKITEMQLIKDLYKFLYATENLYISRFLILKAISLIVFLCSNKKFTDADIEINKKRIKKVREKLLLYLNNNENQELRIACNKLDEIVLDKSIDCHQLIDIIKYMIDIQEDTEIIKKIISINKECITANECYLFDYVFAKSMDAINNNNYLITYYLTLLKIFYSSKVNKERYHDILDNSIENKYTNELYYIVLGNKRPLHPDQILEKYNKRKPKSSAIIKSPTSPTINNNRIITIDGSSSILKDDAISIMKDGSNYVIHIYVTDVGYNIDYDSDLDNEAMSIFKNSYINGKVIEIFKKSFSSQLSLLEGKKRKTIILELVMNDSGDLLDYSIKSGNIVIAKNLTYFGVDQTLSNNKAMEYTRDLSILYGLAKILRDKYDEKLKYRASKEGSNIYVRKYSTKSHMIVEEFSILYNKLLARNAENIGFPYIYRALDKSYVPQLIADKQISLDDHAKEIVDSIFLEAYYTSKPKKHTGLNEKIYSQSGGPLRRYPAIYDQYLYHKYFFKDKDFDDTDFERMIQYINKRNFETRLFEEEYYRSTLLLKK